MSIAHVRAATHQNHLLSKLTEEQLQPVLPLFDLVETRVQEVLLQQGKPINYVYFPCRSAHSCMMYLEDGSAVEVGTIGNESFTGIEVLLDATLATQTVVCQIGGPSLRMDAEDFRKLVRNGSALTNILRRSGQAYLTQVSQSVACNRLHSTDMRFARWLLITHDRVQNDEFELTQEFLAAMLGVHRPSVSVVAGLFQQAGMIRYSRGRMKILNRSRLEESTCECYATVRSHFERLLGVPRG
jgi:CRP-like cAMP-binding protein